MRYLLELYRLQISVAVENRDNLCAISEDLYVNISGTWTKQTKHIKDSKGLPCHQYHVRSWAVNDNLVIGSAHEERVHIKSIGHQVDIKHVKGTTPTWERDVPGKLLLGYHILDGFDSAEDELAGEFSGDCWSVSKDSRNLNNQYTRTYYSNNNGSLTKLSSAFNDGSATEILCS